MGGAPNIKAEPLMALTASCAVPMETGPMVEKQTTTFPLPDFPPFLMLSLSQILNFYLIKISGQECKLK